MIKLIGNEKLDDVLQLIQEVVEGLNSDGIDQWDEKYPAREDLETDILNETAYGYFDSGRLSAYIVLNEEVEPQYGEVEWEYDSGRPLMIHRLSVHPDLKGRGIGRAMVSFAEAEAFERGYQAVRLDAFSMNPAALRLYEKSGYRRAGSVHFRKGQFYLFEKKLK